MMHAHMSTAMQLMNRDEGCSLLALSPRARLLEDRDVVGPRRVRHVHRRRLGEEARIEVGRQPARVTRQWPLRFIDASSKAARATR